nr:hypothetical protein [Tanacetum cinerariifolium]
AGVKNVVGVSDQVIRRTIPARSSERLIALSPQVAGKAMAYKPSLRSIVGDPQRSASASGFAYRYPLPWVGGPFRISQGANGSYSHVGAKSRYAIDIAMPEGTQIIAARGGTVIKTENAQSGRGFGERQGRSACGCWRAARALWEHRQQHRPPPALRGATQCGAGAGVDSVRVLATGPELAEFRHRRELNRCRRSATCVGARLPANAIYLRNGSWMTYRVRQQAGSYRMGFDHKLAGSAGLVVTTAGTAIR